MANKNKSQHKPFSKPFWKMTGGIVLSFFILFAGIEVVETINSKQLCTDREKECVGLAPSNDVDYGTRKTLELPIVDGVPSADGTRLQITNKDDDKSFFIPLKTEREIAAFLESAKNGSMKSKVDVCAVGVPYDTSGSIAGVNVVGCEEEVDLNWSIEIVGSEELEPGEEGTYSVYVRDENDDLVSEDNYTIDWEIDDGDEGETDDEIDFYLGTGGLASGTVVNVEVYIQPNVGGDAFDDAKTVLIYGDSGGNGGTGEIVFNGAQCLNGTNYSGGDVDDFSTAGTVSISEETVFRIQVMADNGGNSGGYGGDYTTSSVVFDLDGDNLYLSVDSQQANSSGDAINEGQIYETSSDTIVENTFNTPIPYTLDLSMWTEAGADGKGRVCIVANDVDTDNNLYNSVDGQCGYGSAFACIAGTAINTQSTADPGDGAMTHTWDCQGIYAGTTDTSCLYAEDA